MTQAKRADAEAKRAQERQKILKQNKLNKTTASSTTTTTSSKKSTTSSSTTSYKTKKKASTKPVNEEVERVRTRLKEMELKAKAINNQTPGKDVSGKNKASGGVNTTTATGTTTKNNNSNNDEESPAKPTKPAPKK